MGANTYGRQVVIPLTNKSGGSVAAGDVVVIDTTNNDAFTTDTAGAFTGGVGVVQETIANNGTGKVLTAGYAALVNVNASVTRGQFGKTHTVAKQATGTASRGVGTFCQWLTGGTTPDAIVYPVDLLGSSLTNPMTTKGDVIQGDTGGTPVRLAAGTSGYVLTAGGAGAFSAWAAPAVAARVGCQAYNSAVQNVNSTTAVLTLDTESYDTSAFHSTSSNTSRMVAPVTGVYSCTASTFTSASGLSFMTFYVNGAIARYTGTMSNGFAASGYFAIAADILLTAGDYVEIAAFTTANINLGHASSVSAQTSFSISLLSA